MPIEGFDYKAFATDLAKQALQVLMQKGTNAAPEGLTDAQKKYIVETVQRFCYMSGEALSKDPKISFTAEQASIITQFIGEWAFHKSIDLMRGQIQKQVCDGVLQIIAANIFNTAKLAIIKKMPDDALISLVEEKVKMVYKEELDKALQKNTITQEQYEKALNASNLNEMVQKEEAAHEKQTPPPEAASPETAPPSPDTDKKVLKFAALSILLKNLPEEKAGAILAALPPNDANHVANYMKMNDIEDKIDHSVIISAFEEIKKIIPLSEEAKTAKLLKTFRAKLSATAPDVLSSTAMNEREKVKEFILDTDFPALEIFSPFVVKSLIKNIENKINNDN